MCNSRQHLCRRSAPPTRGVLLPGLFVVAAGAVVVQVCPAPIANAAVEAVFEVDDALSQLTIEASATVLIFTVSDDDIRAAMVLFWQKLKLLIEPSSATVIAAVRNHPEVFGGRKVGAVISGGNIHPSDWVELTGCGLTG